MLNNFPIRKLEPFLIQPVALVCSSASETRKRIYSTHGCNTLDILRFMYEEQKEHNFANLGETYIKHRKVVVEWMIDVCEYFSLHPTTSHLAVAYLDRIQPNGKFSRFDWQMLAICCIIIGSKYNECESNVPDLHTLEEITHQSIPNSKLLSYELWTLKRLGWKLHARTPMSFLSAYMSVSVLFQTDRYQPLNAGYLIALPPAVMTVCSAMIQMCSELCLVEPLFKQYLCSDVATVIVYIARRNCRIAPVWTNELCIITNCFDISHLCGLIELMDQHVTPIILMKLGSVEMYLPGVVHPAVPVPSEVALSPVKVADSTIDSSQKIYREQTLYSSEADYAVDVSDASISFQTTGHSTTQHDHEEEEFQIHGYAIPANMLDDTASESINDSSCSSENDNSSSEQEHYKYTTANTSLVGMINPVEIHELQHPAYDESIHITSLNSSVASDVSSVTESVTVDGVELMGNERDVYYAHQRQIMNRQAASLSSTGSSLGHTPTPTYYSQMTNHNSTVVSSTGDIQQLVESMSSLLISATNKTLATTAGMNVTESYLPVNVLFPLPPIPPSAPVTAIKSTANNHIKLPASFISPVSIAAANISVDYGSI